MLINHKRDLCPGLIDRLECGTQGDVRANQSLFPTVHLVLLLRARRCANQDATAIEISRDDSACRHQCPWPQPYALLQHGSSADVALVPYVDVAADHRTGRHVNILAERAVVLDDCTGIDNAASTDRCTDLDNAAREQLNRRIDASALRNDCRSMAHTDKLPPFGLHLLLNLAAQAAAADTADAIHQPDPFGGKRCENLSIRPKYAQTVRHPTV